MQRDSRSKSKGLGVGALGAGFRSAPAASYHESETGHFLAQQKQTLPPRDHHAAPAAANITPPQQQFVNECKVVTWLQEEMNRVLSLIGTLGNPKPEQAAKLLNQYTASVTTMIPYSPPEVKQAVVGAFAKCNWDVLRRKPTAGSQPPSGKTLCDLIFELGVYFCFRTKQNGPPAGFVDLKLAEYRAKLAPKSAPRPQPAIPSVAPYGKGASGKPYNGGKGYQHSGGKGGKGYSNDRGGYQGGKGKGGKGGKGKGSAPPRV